VLVWLVSGRNGENVISTEEPTQPTDWRQALPVGPGAPRTGSRPRKSLVKFGRGSLAAVSSPCERRPSEAIPCVPVPPAF
jgi:hypothetical protein